jgi:hypothetical protein
MTEHVQVRMGSTAADAERLDELLHRLPLDVQERVVDQVWLRAVFVEQRRRTNVRERAAFEARADKLLAALDPPERRPVTITSGERYARNVVYMRWVPVDQFRPVESYDDLAGAINRSDELAGGGLEVQVIDLENVELGDMRVAEACADMVARIRAER